MTSVYYDKNGKLFMPHYCAVANQPRLMLSKAHSNMMNIVYVDGENLNPETDMHIYRLEIEFEENERVVHRWQGFKDGKPFDKTILEMVRRRG